jgi:hypothetical protein
MACGREIDDGKPPMKQHDAGIQIDPAAVIVGPAVPQAAAHGAGDIAELASRTRRPTRDESSNTAHGAELVATLL